MQNAQTGDLLRKIVVENGHDPRDTSGGWTASYNFGSEDAARLRWRAAIRAGVDFIATDQYELLRSVLIASRR